MNLICDSLFELDLKYNVTINPLIENQQVFNEYKDYSLLFENIEKDGVVPTRRGNPIWCETVVRQTVKKKVSYF